jgi:hypothetical protein
MGRPIESVAPGRPCTRAPLKGSLCRSAGSEDSFRQDRGKRKGPALQDVVDHDGRDVVAGLYGLSLLTRPSAGKQELT